MNLSSCLYCIYYNLLSNFYISISTFLPGFEQDIVNLQYKTIQSINEDYVFAYNTRKRKRFNIFVENLVKRNNDFLEKIRHDEYEDNDLENYDRIDNTECSNYDDESEQDSDYSNQDTENNSIDGDKNNDENGNEDGNEDGNEYVTEETIYEDDTKKTN
jgi:hypothetical protein